MRQIRRNKRHFLMRDRIKDGLSRAIEAQILRKSLSNVKDISHRLKPIARSGAGSVHIQHPMAIARLSARPFANSRPLCGQKRRKRPQQRIVNAAIPLRIGVPCDRDERTASIPLQRRIVQRNPMRYGPSPHSEAHTFQKKRAVSSAQNSLSKERFPSSRAKSPSPKNPRPFFRIFHPEPPCGMILRNSLPSNTAGSSPAKLHKSCTSADSKHRHKKVNPLKPQ